MTLREALDFGKKTLREAGVKEADLDAWYLLSHVTGYSRSDYYLREKEALLEAQEASYQKLLAERGKRIPLQHLTGEQEFMGFSFVVNEHVLIPRQDTETLVEEALAFAGAGTRVLDLCTGSGCIGISLFLLGACSSVTAADISPEALLVAEENRQRLVGDLTGSGRAFILRQSDLFSEIPERFDLIVSNPPYIRPDVIATLETEVRDHEPCLALDGGKDGLDFYRRIVAESDVHLEKGGHLLFEIGHDQGAAVKALMEAAGYGQVRVISDLAGHDRVVCGKKEIEMKEMIQQ